MSNYSKINKEFKGYNKGLSRGMLEDLLDHISIQMDFTENRKIHALRLKNNNKLQKELTSKASGEIEALTGVLNQIRKLIKGSEG